MLYQQQSDPTGHDHYTTNSSNAGRRKDRPAQAEHAETSSDVGHEEKKRDKKRRKKTSREDKPKKNAGEKDQKEQQKQLSTKTQDRTQVIL